MSHGIPWTPVRTLSTLTFGRTNSRQTLPPGPKKQRIEAKVLERIPRRSCHHHNRNA